MTGRPLRIGVSCYASFGGSGVVATEIGLHMARRGHTVHFICHGVPSRFDGRTPHVHLHEVPVRDYPLFTHPPHTLALTSTMVDVSVWQKLDILHAHYAVPHSAAAVLARQIVGPGGPKVVSTVHGTDVTLVGSDASYLPVTRWSLRESDAITAPSEALRQVTVERMGLAKDHPITVIPNFVDTDLWAPGEPGARDRIAAAFADCPFAEPMPPEVPTLFHVSNFRPVKRTLDIVDVFAAVSRIRPCRLVMVGDGPDRPRAEARVRQLGLHGRARFFGKQESFVDLLRQADLYVQASELESFGLAALEALSCGVPVVASDVGGVPEVVRDGETGLLVPVGDIPAMAAAVLTLLDDPARRAAMSQRAREDVLIRFRIEPMLDRYEALYRRLLDT